MDSERRSVVFPATNSVRPVSSRSRWCQSPPEKETQMGTVKGLFILAMCLTYAFTLFFVASLAHTIIFIVRILFKSHKSTAMGTFLIEANPVYTSATIKHAHLVDRRG